MKYKQYIGIILGGLYGLLVRGISGSGNHNTAIQDYYNSYSLSFLWVLPLVISIIPMLFAKKEILTSKWKQFVFPFLSVLLFFIFTLSSGFEDWLCILIIALPFLITAGIVGTALAPLIKKRYSKKLYAIVALPFLLSPLESFIPNTLTTYTVTSKILIEADRQTVWSYLIEVPEIKDSEYQKGFFNYIGVPRPVKSKLEIVNGTTYRIGYFSNRLKLYETLATVDTLNYLEFKIHINESELRDLPTDNLLLKSESFTFENISYTLSKQSPTTTELKLACQYTLSSKMNGYANFWAGSIITDFETRLLKSLKFKIESHSP